MQNVLNKIIPSTVEKKNYTEIANTFIKKLQKNLPTAKIILGGSAKKGTLISGNHDIDLFVAFNLKKHLNDNLTEILEKAIKKSFPKLAISKLHGSRDYFQTTYHDYTLEIVPILKITKAEQAQNITDISPLHAQWVNKKATAKVKDDIRLLKQFCKANKLYGAESFISGFSGYVLEILTIHYGSFKKVLQSATKWKKKQIIDPSKFYKKDLALFHINNSKLNSPIIVVDPVDKSRNAAAALSEEKLAIFVRSAKKYLRNPTVELFQVRKINIEKLKTNKDILNNPKPF